MWRRVLRRFLKPTAPTLLPVNRARLGLQILEDRATPVVGASLPLPAVSTGAGFDGVAEISLNGAFCTASLLFTGRHLLTAAHCLDLDRDGAVDAGTVTARFDLPTGPVAISVPSSSVTLHPLWNGSVGAGNDLAIIALPAVGPVGAERYSIHRPSDGPEVGATITVVGYGQTGVGAAGADFTTGGVKRLGFNQVDATGMWWSGPGGGTVLVSDFDDGNPIHDAFGRTSGLWNLGLGAAEANTAPGDSGGPSFIGGQIAAVTSFGYATAYLLPFPADPFGYGFPFFPWGIPIDPTFDVTRPAVDSSFGEFMVNTRVSAFAGFIDAAVAGSYDLVLDMNTQPGGNDGVADTIVAQPNGGLYELFVNGVLVHSDLQSNIRSVTIRGSLDADVIMLTSVSGMPAAIDSGGGADRVTITAGASSSIAADTGAGGDILDIRAGAGSFVRLDAGGGNDTINVLEAGPGSSVEVKTGPTDVGVKAQNVVQIGGSNGPGTDLTPIRGSVRVIGGDGLDQLFIIDSGFGGGREFHLAVGSFNWLTPTGFSSVLYQGVERLTATFGFGGDLVRVDGTDSAVSVRLTDTGGRDTLSYELYAEGVYVNLFSRQATGLAEVIGFEDVRGSNGADVLVGNDVDNRLMGLGGRDLLIGRFGDDELLGGDDWDILIGGHTTHDLNQGVLEEIRNRWAMALDRESGIDEVDDDLNSGTITADPAGADMFDDFGPEDWRWL